MNRKRKRKRVIYSIKVDSSTNYSRLGVRSYKPDTAEREWKGTTGFEYYFGFWEWVHHPSDDYQQKVKEVNKRIRHPHLGSIHEKRCYEQQETGNRSAILMARIFNYYANKPKKSYPWNNQS